MRRTLLSDEAVELTTEDVKKAYQDSPSELMQLRNALMLSHITLIECSYYAEGQAKKTAQEQIKSNEILLGL